MTKDETPVGSAIVLAMNPDAMQKVVMHGEEQNQETVAGIHAVKSREEMHKYVDSIVNKQ